MDQRPGAPFDRSASRESRVRVLEHRKRALEAYLGSRDGAGCTPAEDIPYDGSDLDLYVCLLEARVNYLENLSLCEGPGGSCDAVCAEQMKDQWMYERGLCFVSYQRTSPPAAG